MSGKKQYVYKPRKSAILIQPRNWVKTRGGKKEVCIGSDVTTKNGQHIPQATPKELEYLYEELGLVRYIEKKQVDVPNKEPDTPTDKG